MSAEPTATDFKYWAFISYAPEDDKWANWLHKGLECYRVPKNIVGKQGRDGAVPGRAFPCFRDRDELAASGNRRDDIERALRQSRFLIVVCSPYAVRSQSVDEEIRFFKSLGREDRVLFLIVGEAPEAETREAMLARFIPAAARSSVTSEPNVADARSGRDGKPNALLKLLAGILGVSFDDLKQRAVEREHLRMQFALSAVGALLVIFALLSVQAFVQRQRALQSEKQAVEALKAAVAAERGERRARDEAVAQSKKALEAMKAEAEARKTAEDALRRLREASAPK
jgi:hypothetical protein